MAIDNLNYYSAGLPAGQLTDKYSSQPGCLKSKNLDIFSSSKSVKATAWSEPITIDADVIKQDGNLILKTDGKVYERGDNGDTLVVDPSTNFPVYKVNYDGTSYADAQWGTPEDIVAKYEGDELKSFVVFTDRASYTWSSVKYTPTKTFSEIENFTLQYSGTPTADGYYFKQTTVSNVADIAIDVENPPFTSMLLKIKAIDSVNDDTTISLQEIRLGSYKYLYDGEQDAMIPKFIDFVAVPYTGNIADGITVEIPLFPYTDKYQIVLDFAFTKKPGASTYGWGYGQLYVDMNGGPESTHRMKIDDQTSDGDYNDYYSYLPVKDRKLATVGEYYRMKGASFQTLYRWQGSWVDVNGFKKTRYDFVQYMGRSNDVSMDIVGLISRNEQVYMIGNMDGNGYIIPCDLSGGVGVAYIAYGCEFKGVTNIDYLMYLVGEDRGISQLWVYNQQELVPILGGKLESQFNDLIGVDEAYKFNGDLVNWRKNLILSTSDNRIFQYGQTYGGKGGTFIHDLPLNAEITQIRANKSDLEIKYSITENNITTSYITKYQDDTPYKNYNTEWSSVYPIVIGNHLLEKEESDLFASYILPSSDCSLEFRGMANHYHFWTFISSDNVTIDPTGTYKIAGATGDYELKFIERNDDQYTFRLEGDLPVQTTSVMKITDDEGADVINYTQFNHFRKIGEITTDSYQEGEFRFHNLNNKLELPKSHSLQIMVKGKGTTNYTPELFALDLVANQRDRG